MGVQNRLLAQHHSQYWHEDPGPHGLFKGDWISYLNGDNPCKNNLWEGRGQVIVSPKGPKDTLVIEWYELDPATGTFIHAPLPNRQAWHLDPKACFRLKKGHNLNSPNKVGSPNGRPIYNSWGGQGQRCEIE
jgi:hypothetical protein